MHTALLPIIPMMITVPLLIRAELAKNARQIYVFKPLSSTLMLLVALLALTEPGVDRAYLIGILIGLALSWVGDVLLMFPGNKKAFLGGLVAFLLGHVAYTVTLIPRGGLGWLDLAALVVLITVMVVFYNVLKPGLGSMRVPVLAYIVVISLMVSRALSTLFATQFEQVWAWMVVVGAVLFYISDMMLAYGHFVRPLRYERFSLIFYYTGQVLIGLSISYLR